MGEEQDTEYGMEGKRNEGEDRKKGESQKGGDRIENNKGI